MKDLLAFLPLVGIALLFWLLVVRPASRRQAAVRNLQAALKVGDEVLLASGIYGTIRSVDADKVALEVAEGVVLTVALGSVVKVVDAERSS